MARIFIGNIKGPKGDKGSSGKDGIDGKSPKLSIEKTESGVLIEAHNPDGSTAVGQVLHGKDGKQGPQGIQGEKGEQGVQGVQGERGDTGLQGERGEQGPRGERGEKGEPGRDGVSFDATKSIVEFEEAKDDLPIVSGDTVTTHFGRIKRLFTRVKTVEDDMDSLEISQETQEAFKAIGWTPPTGGGRNS